MCPLCGSTSIKKRYTCKDHFATGELFDIYECIDCSFVFTQGAPDEREIARYYESPEYISHSNTQKGLLNKLFHVVRNIMLKRKAGLIKKLTFLKSGKLLDYGAGIGYFADKMVQKGWEVTAIEKSEKARKAAFENLGLEMLPEESMSQQKEGYFNVVTLWHVMEHIQEPDNLWEQIYRVLDESGIAVVAVPNCSSFDAEYYQEHWAAYDVPRHLWHFTPSTINEMARRHNFIMERCYTMPFDGFYISMLSEKYKQSTLAALRGVWNGFIGWMASFDKNNASSSIIYVFRKKKKR